MFRISYCSADATFDHVFAFIATNRYELYDVCLKYHDVMLEIGFFFSHQNIFSHKVHF